MGPWVLAYPTVQIPRSYYDRGAIHAKGFAKHRKDFLSEMKCSQHARKREK